MFRLNESQAPVGDYTGLQMAAGSGLMTRVIKMVIVMMAMTIIRIRKKPRKTAPRQKARMFKFSTNQHRQHPNLLRKLTWILL